jgi:predicted nucleic-acid-binding protein
MIGVDTNILLRFLVEDDPDQNEKARHFLWQRTAEDPAYISAMVLAEMAWYLRRRLSYPQSQILELLRLLLASAEVVVEYAGELDVLLAEQNASATDLADHLIAWASAKAGCRATLTFDRKAAARVPGMELLA